MRKVFALFLAICLLSCAGGALADHGEADVSYFNGEYEVHLVLTEMVLSEEGDLKVTITGFSGFVKQETDIWGNPTGMLSDIQFAASICALVDEEPFYDSLFFIHDEGITFTIDGVGRIPDELQVIPTDGPGPVTLWTSEDPVPVKEEAAE